MNDKISAILAEVAAGRATPAQAQQAIASLVALQTPAPRAATLSVSRNKSGGLYVRHPAFKSHSAAKQKDYVAGINFPTGVGEVLFARGPHGDTLRAEIVAAVASL